jgi:alkylation response protein AidB-like acyl-CoA dehydrogenase
VKGEAEDKGDSDAVDLGARRRRDAEGVIQQEIVAAVREFVDREVVPVASQLEHADEYPAALVDGMRELGLFGVAIPEAHGGLGLDLETYALINEELSRGWMSLSGILNGHFVTAWMIERFGTGEQQRRWLPRLATGEIRAAFAMTEPHAGSDLQAIRTRAERDGDAYVVTGEKTWITNALRATLLTLLVKTDLAADPPHRGTSTLIVEKEPEQDTLPGLVIRPLDKLGYKGLETCSVVFDGFRVPAASLLGSEEGSGFRQFMAAIELGRVNIAARGVGVAQAALDASLRYAREREAFGKPIADHQAIQLKLAQMATKVEAARQLTLHAARRKQTGERADLEAGMAKLFASEVALECAEQAMRIHGGYGYSPEYVVERLYRDAPLLVIGEGTNEIQQLVIARRLLERHS